MWLKVLDFSCHPGLVWISHQLPLSFLYTIVYKQMPGHPGTLTDVGEFGRLGEQGKSEKEMTADGG